MRSPRYSISQVSKLTKDGWTIFFYFQFYSKHFPGPKNPSFFIIIPIVSGDDKLSINNALHNIVNIQSCILYQDSFEEFDICFTNFLQTCLDKLLFIITESKPSGVDNTRIILCKVRPVILLGNKTRSVQEYLLRILVLVLHNMQGDKCVSISSTSPLVFVFIRGHFKRFHQLFSVKEHVG